MNAGRMASSDRLKRIYELLFWRGPDGATSLEIQEKCGTVAPGTCVSELRHNGYNIECCYLRRTEEGRKVYKYTLKSA